MRVKNLAHAAMKRMSSTSLQLSLPYWPIRCLMIPSTRTLPSPEPPPAFSGGGKWEAMHGEMSGFYEVRVDGPKRCHYRLFCLLERQGASLGLGGPSVVLIAAKDKPFMTVLSAADYAEVKALGAEYRKRTPKSVMP